MTTRPLILRAHEAQAIQADRLSLIVRPMKRQPHYGRNGILEIEHPRDGALTQKYWLDYSPFGKPGDVLWCRETWGHDAPDLDACRRGVESDGPHYGPYYAADADWFDNKTVKMLSPVTMPRWASRWSLRVIETGCKRVQEMTEAEAVAAACPAPDASWYPDGENAERALSAICAFSAQWDSDHGPGAWNRNEWVWTARVERVEG